VRKVERWILQLGEVFVGLVIGLVIWLITDRKPDTLVAPLIMGVLLALTFEVFRTYFWIEETLKEVDRRLTKTFRLLESRLAPREAQLKAVASTWVNKEIAGDDLPKAWMELLLATEKKYRGSNFQPPADMYGPHLRDSVIAIQAAKIVSKVSVAKVFIYQDPQEFEKDRMPEIIKDHQRFGIAMKRIDVKTILENRVLKEKRSKLSHSMHFALFDDQVAFAWELNDKREPVSGRVFLSDSREYTAYSEFYDELESAASQMGH
jgi:hypothetical protein